MKYHPLRSNLKILRALKHSSRYSDSLNNTQSSDAKDVKNLVMSLDTTLLIHCLTSKLQNKSKMPKMVTDAIDEVITTQDEHLPLALPNEEL